MIKIRRYIYLFVCTMVMFTVILTGQALGLDNGHAKMVTNVSGLQNYQLHWNDRFPPGSTVMIYIEADGVNHRRAVGVDYVIVIKDSNDNIVNTTVVSNRYQDYRENDFILFKLDVNNTWEDGTYLADIHIFDLLNDSIMRDHYKNVTTSLLNGSSDAGNIPYMNRSDIINNTELRDRQYKNIIQNFYTDKFADKYPASRFIIQNMSLDRHIIAPGIPIIVSLDVTNTFYDRGTVLLDVMLDNKVVSNNSIDVDAYSSTKTSFEIPIEATEFIEYGNHTLEIIPVTSNTVGFDLSTYVKVEQIKIEIPARFIYREMRINKLSYRPNETINVIVTIENKGREGAHSVGLLVNDALVEKQTVSMNYSEIRDLNFSFTEKEIGQYKLTINDTNISKIIFVEEEELAREGVVSEEEKIKAEEQRIFNILVMLGLSILIILTYIIRKTVISKGLKEVDKIDTEDLRRRVR